MSVYQNLPEELILRTLDDAPTTVLFDLIKQAPNPRVYEAARLQMRSRLRKLRADVAARQSKARGIMEQAKEEDEAVYHSRRTALEFRNILDDLDRTLRDLDRVEPWEISTIEKIYPSIENKLKEIDWWAARAAVWATRRGNRA